MVTFERSNEEPLTQPPQKRDPSRRPPTIPYAGGSAPSPAAAATAPPAPPPPPRPITPAATRRSWAEPVIRFWVLATLVLVGIGGWFLTQQVLASRDEQKLISTGTVVTARIVEANGDSHAMAPVGSDFTLEFDLQGQSTTVHGMLATQAGPIKPGTFIQLHVDPNDPGNWTDRQQPDPLGRRLIAGAVIIPAALITAIAALVVRQRLLRVWREGDAALFSVVETRYSALAPLSHTVRCVSSLGRDPTIVTVYLPNRFPRPQTGEVLWLIHPLGKAKAAIAARAFE